MLLPQRRSPPHIRLLLKSVIYRSLLLWEKVPRNEADEEGVKGRCDREKFVYVTDTSSVLPSVKRLGKPPSPTGEGFGKIAAAQPSVDETIDVYLKPVGTDVLDCPDAQKVNNMCPSVNKIADYRN